MIRATIPTRAEARSDPAHKLWFAWVDAVAQAQRTGAAADIVAVEAAWRAFLADYERPRMAMEAHS